MGFFTKAANLIKKGGKNLLKWAVVILVIVILSRNFLRSFLISVPPGTVGVMMDNFRGILDRELEPGYHLKIPLVQHVQIYDTTIQELSFWGEESIGSQTNEGQQVDMDVTIRYRLHPDEASVFRATVGEQLGSIEEKLFVPVVRSVVRQKVPTFTYQDLFSEGRATLEESITETVREQVSEYGIEVKNVDLRGIFFSEELRKSIEQKQLAEQKAQQLENELKQAEVQRQIAITQSEGEAEAIRIKAQAEADSIRAKAQALRENAALVDMTLAEKWNGEVPMILGGDNSYLFGLDDLIKQNE